MSNLPGHPMDNRSVVRKTWHHSRVVEPFEPDPAMDSSYFLDEDVDDVE
ncbi:MAG TPA: hypothetical protein VFF32_03020 [Dermatophilaceae bacterium]|nr:hypothetical protein [Dermatophilaceae bacterium]